MAASHSATDLLASALGLPRGGGQACCFCGGPASRAYELPDSFTARDLDDALAWLARGWQAECSVGYFAQRQEVRP